MRYCSRVCQKAHWKEHKEECNRVVMKCWFKAAVQGRFDDIKRLLKRGLKVNSMVIHAHDGGQTALNCAGEGDHMEIAALLLENKAGVDKATSKGGTPLFLVSQEGKLEVVKWLVEDGKADVDKATNDGCTPLYVASVLGQLEIVKDMKGKGAKD